MGGNGPAEPFTLEISLTQNAIDMPTVVYECQFSCRANANDRERLVARQLIVESSRERHERFL